MTCSSLEVTENRERERELISEVHNLSGYWLVASSGHACFACHPQQYAFISDLWQLNVAKQLGIVR